MRKIYLLLLGSAFSLLSIAQDNATVKKNIPQFFNYHSITTELNKPIVVTIDILDKDRTTLYSEVHNVTTNSAGAFSLQIGMGTPSGTATLSSVDWEAAMYGRTTIGADKSEFTLSSVPYAMMAQSVMGLEDAIESIVNEKLSNQSQEDQNTEGSNQNSEEISQEIEQQITQQTQEIEQQITQQTQEIEQQITQ